MTNQRHIIKKQILELELTSQENAFETQNRVSRVYREQVVPIIEACCTCLSESEVIHRIDSLELAIGTISIDTLEEVFPERVRIKLEDLIREKLSSIECSPSSSDEAISVSSQKNKHKSQIELFDHFIRKGILPWWSGKLSWQEHHDNLFTLIESSPQFIADVVAKNLDNEKAIKRLVYQYPDEILIKIASLFAPDLKSFIYGNFNVLLQIINISHVRKDISITETRLELWRAVFVMLVQQKRKTLREFDLLQGILMYQAEQMGVKYKDYLNRISKAINISRCRGLDNSLDELLRKVCKEVLIIEEHDITGNEVNDRSHKLLADSDKTDISMLYLSSQIKELIQLLSQDEPYFNYKGSMKFINEKQSGREKQIQTSLVDVEVLLQNMEEIILRYSSLNRILNQIKKVLDTISKIDLQTDLKVRIQVMISKVETAWISKDKEYQEKVIDHIEKANKLLGVIESFIVDMTSQSVPSDQQECPRQAIHQNEFIAESKISEKKIAAWIGNMRLRINTKSARLDDGTTKNIEKTLGIVESFARKMYSANFSQKDVEKVIQQLLGIDLPIVFRERLLKEIEAVPENEIPFQDIRCEVEIVRKLKVICNKLKEFAGKERSIENLLSQMDDLLYLLYSELDESSGFAKQPGSGSGNEKKSHIKIEPKSDDPELQLKQVIDTLVQTYKKLITCRHISEVLLQQIEKFLLILSEDGLSNHVRHSVILLEKEIGIARARICKGTILKISSTDSEERDVISVAALSQMLSSYQQSSGLNTDMESVAGELKKLSIHSIAGTDNNAGLAIKITEQFIETLEKMVSGLCEIQEQTGRLETILQSLSQNELGFEQKQRIQRMIEEIESAGCNNNQVSTKYSEESEKIIEESLAILETFIQKVPQANALSVQLEKLLILDFPARFINNLKIEIDRLKSSSGAIARDFFEYPCVNEQDASDMLIRIEKVIDSSYLSESSLAVIDVVLQSFSQMELSIHLENRIRGVKEKYENALSVVNEKKVHMSKLYGSGFSGEGLETVIPTTDLIDREDRKKEQLICYKDNREQKNFELKHNDNLIVKGYQLIRRSTQEQSYNKVYDPLIAYNALLKRNSICHNADLFSDSDEIYIYNAGLILLWPFFRRFFENVGLMSEKQFISQDATGKAIYLLQYLVDGSTEVPEYVLPLNKVICGMHLNEPANGFLEISEQESIEAETLLNAAIHNWSALGKISVEGFRASFLQREGLLTRRDSNWLIRVERKMHDVLLDRISWTIGVIKLPWLDNFICVEW